MSPPLLARRARWRGVVAAVAVALLAGCATPPPPAPSKPSAASHWSGRLALSLATDPPQHWSAGFELSGTPAQGELRLSTPLGQTLATIRWDGSGAWVERRDTDPRPYDGLDALTADLIGTPVPVTALFAWLRGVPHEAPGWQVDLSQQPTGRLRLRRSDPPPAADLRLIWQP